MRRGSRRQHTAVSSHPMRARATLLLWVRAGTRRKLDAHWPRDEDGDAGKTLESKIKTKEEAEEGGTDKKTPASEEEELMKILEDAAEKSEFDEGVDGYPVGKKKNGKERDDDNDDVDSLGSSVFGATPFGWVETGQGQYLEQQQNYQRKCP